MKQGRLPILDVIGFSYTYPNGVNAALRDIDWQVFAGECCLVAGPSGSGKTTLLMAMQGLLDGYDRSCVERHPQQDIKIRPAMVFQNADSQILCTTVRDEVSFGPENLGFSPAETAAAVAEALSDVGLKGFEDRNVEALSAGEKHRLTLAAILSMKPDILLLDEPSAQLDDASKEQLKRILMQLKEKNHTLIIADHDLALYDGLADRCVTMKAGRIERIDVGLPPKRVLDGADRLPRKVKAHYGEEPTICVENLFLAGHRGAPLLRDISFNAGPEETVYLYGLNGAGKSTLLACLAGLIQPDNGTIRIAGCPSPRPEKLLGKAALLFQNPSRQLFEETVFDEVAFSLKRLGMPQDQIKAAVFEALALFDIEALADRSPLTLSFGEQHRVALASVLAPRPAVLLLDEPFAGLDFDQRILVSDALLKLRERNNTTIVIASHTGLPDPSWPDVKFFLSGGCLETF